jgi:DNA-binding response OmpR family regulator
MTEARQQAQIEHHQARADSGVGCGPALSMVLRRIEALAHAVENLEGRVRAADLDSPAQPVAQPQEPSRLIAGKVTIDHDARRAYLGDRPLELSVTEYKVLYELAKSPGRVLTTSDLMRRTRGVFSPDKSYVKVYVGRLRAKMSLAGGTDKTGTVETVRGVGYRLVA